MLACALLAIGLLLPRPLGAAPRPVVIEIDPRAELLIDARAARRLTLLELADVDVPPSVNSQRSTLALFLRVLGSEGGVVSVELWELGEFCGTRRFSVAANSQLGARRVALAAAELARQLRQKRLVRIERAERERYRRAIAAERAANRTADGPRALRSAAAALWLPASEFFEVGPRLSFELHVLGALRLDVGGEWLFGSAVDRAARSSRLGLVVSPARRFALSRRLDLDLGLEVGLSAVHFDPVHAVDGIVGQSETWTARVGAAVRFQPRLTRNLRLSIGPSAGVVLRRMPIEFERGERDGLGGAWLGAEVGLVLTPGAR